MSGDGRVTVSERKSMTAFGMMALGYIRRRIITAVSRRTLVMLACLLAGSGPAASRLSAQEPATGTIRGRVLDARDGAGLQKVSVRLQDTGQASLTAADGAFELTGVTAGAHELYISSVDFILVRRIVTVTAGAVMDLTIPIAAGTGTYAETVTVRSTAGAQADPAVAAQQTLESNDLQQLRGLLTNDPFRAIQVLPGVASGDDLRSEFTVRGMAIDHMNFTFEGVQTPLLVHTVQGVSARDSGSVAMVNGDVLREISLSNGSYPQRFGSRTGAELDFLMREGSRDSLKGHVGVSVTDASFVAEGPIGGARRGSWLLSVRKSYLDMVIRRLDPSNTFGFGFSDAQSKLVYDLSARHQLQIALTAGRSRLQQEPSDLGLNDVREGLNATGVAVLTWRYLASPRLILTQKVAGSANGFRNSNTNGLELARGRTSDLLYRTDWSFAPAPGILLQGAGEAHRSAASRFDRSLRTSSPAVTLEAFDATGLSTSAWAAASLRTPRGTLTSGARVDHSTLTDHTTLSPWLQAGWPLIGSVAIRAGGGIYRQEPGFVEARGLHGDRGLRTERAYHADAGIDGRLGGAGKWQVTFYDREDRDLLRLPDSAIRLVNGVLVRPASTSRYENALDGHSRGAELLLQRRSPNGLSGWIAYDLAYTRYRDRRTGETFWGDFDQRHTLNTYANYRVSDRMSVSARFRAGSNFPAPGYWDARGDAYVLSDRLNTVRVPPYSRLDIRANRTFAWQRTRLTLFVEVLNAYNRTNVRVASPGVDVRTFQVFGLFDPMFPLVPSAGLLLEF